MKNLYQFLLLFLLCTSFSTFAQVPLYNSYPSAAATIYLDFDGQYVQGTSWNVNGPIACGPSGMDATQIAQIFNRVAEDYRPFNVNVTTDSAKYWAAPANQRIRVILTVTSDWYGAAGGVSYMGSFTWGDNTPAFVFTAALASNAKYIAEAASHEAGHTLGLRHQSSYNNSCAKTAEYNPGQGSGEIGWAPIMGVGYYKNLTLWNNGANPYGCTNYQNDLEVITTYNGFTYRNDDYGSSFGGSATKANFTNDRFTMNGIVETSTDIDVIKFTVPTFGRFKLDAIPFNLGDGYTGANLDMQVDLMTSSSNVISSYNPSSSLKSSVDTMLSAGNYFLRVKGSGNINTSEYASLGSYTLEASFAAGIVLPLHKLELHGANENNKHRFDWAIEADEAITTQTLEVSYNGRNYQALTQPEVNSRNYSYVPGKSSTLFYRLNLTLASGQQYYSNIISLPAADHARPELVSNMIRSSMAINSPALYDYTIVDYSGRQVFKGKLVQGVNSLPANMNRGMYLIQFSNGSEQYTEKFMKQ
jgi:hypothetical protein